MLYILKTTQIIVFLYIGVVFYTILFISKSIRHLGKSGSIL